jgi:hypothetical protein
MKSERGTFMRRLGLTLVCFAALSTAAFAQDDHRDASPIVDGYAVITATGGITPFDVIAGRLVVFETFGWRSQVPALQAAVLPATLTTRMVLLASANTSLSRDVGVGITNPGNVDASVTMTLRDTRGNLSATKTIALPSRRQTSQFVGEFFANGPALPSAFDGTLTLTSNTPVAIVALRFTGTKFTTIPITSLSPSAELPVLQPNVGGSAALLLPLFVADGGWASEVVAVNNSAVQLTVRIDLFKQDGTPFVTTLNHQVGSSFPNLDIPPGGVIMFSPRNANGDSDF